MAVIAKTNAKSTGPVAVSSTTLGASDTFVYDSSKMSLLTLRNPTGGALSPIITGSAATDGFLPKFGVVSVAGGYPGFGSIAAGAVKTLDLSAIAGWLEGTLTITSGSGLIATLTEY